ncbi:MAG: hypothetical protein LBI20_03170 [Holosporales bacterium]|jgi:hypothetical protein|nr:hypothetical protein [Holosporales bacterium]
MLVSTKTSKIVAVHLFSGSHKAGPDLRASFGDAVIDIDMENDYSIRVINPHNPAVSFQVRNPHTTENSFVPITGTSLTHALHGANLSSVIHLIETIPIPNI